MKGRYLLSVWVCFFLSCSKEIELDLPFEGEKLVVNAVLSPLHPIEVSVSHTLPPTGEVPLLPEELGIINAQVLLFEDSMFLEELQHQGKGRYRTPSELKPQEGKAYHVEVHAPGYNSVASQPSRFPKGITIRSIEVVDSVLVSPFVSDEPAGLLTIDFGGFSKATSFHEIKLIPTYSNGRADNIGPGVWLPDFTEEQLEACEITIGTNGTFFSTRCITDSSYVLRMGIETHDFSTIDLVPILLTSLKVSVRSVSQSYFNYLQTRAQLSGLDLVFSDPPPTTSNIIGGYGLVEVANEIHISVPVVR